MRRMARTMPRPPPPPGLMIVGSTTFYEKTGPTGFLRLVKTSL
jgi:hypothetical protein